jgi:hypothetical protein
MRVGNTEVRFLGGLLGCLGMILLAVLASIVLNAQLRPLAQESSPASARKAAPMGGGGISAFAPNFAA